MLIKKHVFDYSKSITTNNIHLPEHNYKTNHQTSKVRIFFLIYLSLLKRAKIKHS